MRLQLQTGKKNVYSDSSLLNTSDIGVTKAQVWTGLATMSQVVKGINPELAETKGFSAAVVNMSQKVKAIQGGVVQGGNVLRSEFYYQGQKYRIDLENNYGHNLRQ